jgi:hypothetical protein
MAPQQRSFFLNKIFVGESTYTLLHSVLQTQFSYTNVNGNSFWMEQ